MKNKEYKVLDLFCGCGGLSLGFEQAGYNVLLGIDNWEDALVTFRNNHHESETICADLMKLNPEDVEKKIGKQKLDVIVGGPPCQGFSMAGFRSPDDPRNQLFRDFVDIVKANEANDNVFELIKLGFDGELLEFDESYNGVVKVFGDSTIAGFGILEKTGPASIHNSDSVRDFCYHALYELGMDIDILSASGYGLAFSAYTNPKTIGLFDYLDRVAVNQHIEWQDHSKANLIIISLGCNDNSFIQETSDKEERINEYNSKLKRLIDLISKGDNTIRVLMVYGTLNEESAYYLYEQAYENLKPYYYNLHIHKFKGDSSAISNHAYVDAHDRMAEELKQVIKQIL